jgi:hypothetical protein
MLYCSAPCQKFDWPLHKLVCKTFKDHLAVRPSPTHRSAIYFLQSEVLPRFVWINWSSGCQDPVEGLVRFGFNKPLTYDDDRANFVLGRWLEPHHLMTYCPFCSHANESYKTRSANQSLRRIDR